MTQLTIPGFITELSYSRADVEDKLNSKEAIKWIDTFMLAIGMDPSDSEKSGKEEGPRTRFHRYVTGNFKSEGKNYPAKSLGHKNAFYCFSRFVKDTEYKNHLEIAKEIILENWEKAGEALEIGTPVSLPIRPESDKLVVIEATHIEAITVKAFLVTGYGWLPKSKVKFKAGKLQVPAWLAKNAKAKWELQQAENDDNNVQKEA